jgi:hypothetical protein
MQTNLEPQIARVQLSTRELQIDELQEMVRRVVGLAGCPGCGLVGLDVTIRGMAGPQPEPWLARDLFTQFTGPETFGDGVTAATVEGAIVIGQ